MSLWQLWCVKDGPMNLCLKFGQNRVSNSWDIDDFEFWVVVVSGVQSHFCVKPNSGCVRLNWGWVGVLTIYLKLHGKLYKNNRAESLTRRKSIQKVSVMNTIYRKFWIRIGTCRNLSTKRLKLIWTWYIFISNLTCRKVVPKRSPVTKFSIRIAAGRNLLDRTNMK